MGKRRALFLAVLLGVVLPVGDVHGGIEAQGRADWERGKQHLAAGDAGAAKLVFENLLQKRPNDPDILLSLALASLKLRDPETAESYVRRALAQRPEHAEARTLLGWIFMEVRRDYGPAVREYSEVVRLMPGSAEARNNLGVALKKKGDWAPALENFDRALGLRAKYPEALGNRGWVYAERGMWREARRDFEEALRLNARDEAALYGLSRALREERDYAGADAALSRLLAIAPNFVYWLEWGRLQLVRYYWALLLLAGFFYLYSRYRRMPKASGLERRR